LQRQYKRETSIAITFKYSDSVTWWSRQRIIRNIAKFKEYLTGLGISVPDELPPISIGGRSGGIYLPQTYRGEMDIDESRINDPLEATGVFSDYIILLQYQKVFYQDNSVGYSKNPLAPAFYVFAEYYNFSFWNKRPNEVKNPWIMILWKIRESTGKKFTDSLVAAAIKESDDPSVQLQKFVLRHSMPSGSDSNDLSGIPSPSVINTITSSSSQLQNSSTVWGAPLVGFGEAGNLYFCKVLQLADSDIESSAENWLKVKEVMERDGMPIVGCQ
jgi:hypothetical protein